MKKTNENRIEREKNIIPITAYISKRVNDDLRDMAVYANLTLAEVLRTLIEAALYGRDTNPIIRGKMESIDKAMGR